MIEVAVIIALVALLGWDKYQNRKERAKFLNAIMSKNAQDMVNLDLADKTDIKASAPPQAVAPDLIPEEQISDEDFEKYVLKQKEDGS